MQLTIAHNYVLFFNAGATAFTYAYFGQGSGLIYLDNVACTGSEARLLDCYYDPDTSDCGHHEDAGVSCASGETSKSNPASVSMCMCKD